jgi:sugar O-acyltransferase (sialic acid O-acetyltransferase NeuD family)
MEKGVIIWGCGGMGRDVRELCRVLGIPVLGYLDERPEMRGHTVGDVEVLGDIAEALPMRERASVLCAGVGDPALKRRFFDKTVALGFRVAPPIIDPAVRIPPSARIGAGSVIGTGAVISANVRLHDHVIVNMNASIGHDAELHDFVTVSPGANLSGNVTLDAGVFIGSNAAVREKVRIGAGSMVGACAYVHTDIPAGVKALPTTRLEYIPIDPDGSGRET